MEKLFNRLGRIGTGFFVTGVVFSRFIFVVDGGERAVVLDKFKGVKEKVYGEGMHFMIPFIQTPNIFEVRSRYKLIHSRSGTRDLQTVDLSLRILYRPIEEKLPDILNNLGIDYDKKVIDSIGQEVLKSSVAQYNAEQLLTQREKVSLEIRDDLAKRAKDFDIILDDVSITHLKFSTEFAAAIEQKQVAQQMAERAKFIVQQREEEKKASILKAEGESEGALLIAEAINKYGKGLIALRKIEAAQHIAETLTSTPNVTFVTGNTMNMLQIPTSR